MNENPILEQLKREALYNRQQLDEYEESLNQPFREPELAGK